MRITYLVPESGISGGQRVVFQQAEELARRGHEVAIVSPDEPPDWFPLRRAAWERSDFGRSASLARADVAVGTFWTTLPAAQRSGRGAVFHLCQGYEADFSFYADRAEEIRAAYALPTRKLAVAPHVAERLRREGHEVACVGQAFDAEEFPPAPGRRFDAAEPTVLLVGTFEADVKGLREALRGLGEARRRGARFRLRRIATTPFSAEERALRVTDVYEERISPADMSRAYRTSDLLIGPSHSEEGFGLPVLEALSSGLPAALSDTPGHRHIAREAAEYFPCGDAAAIARAVESLLRDPERRRELSRLGPLEARRFRTADVVDRMLAEFSRAFERRGSLGAG